MKITKISFAEPSVTPPRPVDERPAPASALAVPTETARAEVNAAAFMTGMMMPSRDGIYVIGAVAAKVTHAVRSVILSKNHWGF